MKINSNIPMNTQASNAKNTSQLVNKNNSNENEIKDKNLTSISITTEENLSRTPKNPEYTSKIDYAAESSSFTKDSISSFSGSYSSVQANTTQENVLKLLN